MTLFPKWDNLIDYHAKPSLSIDHNPHAPCFLISKQTESGRESKDSVSKVAWYIVSISTYDKIYTDKTWNEKDVTKVRIVMYDDKTRKSVAINMNLNGTTRSIIASLDSIKDYRKEKVTISLYTNKQWYSTSRVNTTSDMVNWSSDLSPISDANRALITETQIDGQTIRWYSKLNDKYIEAISDMWSRPMYQIDDPENDEKFSYTPDDIPRYKEDGKETNTSTDPLDDLPF